jgi:hypothetical protein
VVTVELVLLALGTGISVAAFVLAGAQFAVRAVVQKDVQPLRDTMATLAANVAVLTTAMREARLLHDKDVEHSQKTTDAIYEMLRNHESRITALERPAPPRAKLRVTK